MAAPYYERHLTAVATLLVEKDIVTCEELQALVRGVFPLSGPIGPGRLPSPPQSFAIGDKVRVKNEFVPGHVRMPAYIRNKAGVVVGVSPLYPFPDASGHAMQAPMETNLRRPLQVPRPVAGQLRRCSEPCRRLPELPGEGGNDLKPRETSAVSASCRLVECGSMGS
jgi:Nitrile hydratase beta subunit, C-terminal/Nitrile hydratase beta subunit, N-terminal